MKRMGMLLSGGAALAAAIGMMAPATAASFREPTPPKKRFKKQAPHGSDRAVYREPDRSQKKHKLKGLRP